MAAMILRVQLENNMYAELCMNIVTIWDAQGELYYDGDIAQVQTLYPAIFAQLVSRNLIKEN